jgi:DNA-binding NarL/FixJ family response regulator
MNPKQVANPRNERQQKSSAVRILLVDDNPAILDCVSKVLDGEYTIIGGIVDPGRVPAEVEKSRPDVLILDISMGEISGIDLAKSLQKRGFVGKIVFLTVHADRDFLRAAIGAGGSAYVVKSSLDAELLPAIRAALLGRLFVSACLQCDGAA